MNRALNVIWATAFLLLSFILLTHCQTNTSSITQQTDSTPLDQTVRVDSPIVRCQPVRVGQFSLVTAATGLLRTPAQSKLSFRIGGTISSILAHSGSVVATGQILARLDDRDQRLALRAAQDQMAESLVQLRALIAEYGGSEVDTGSLQPAARVFVLTKSGYYKAQTAIANAQQQLEYTVLKAPYEGVIANLSAKPYNFITSYEPFCTLLSRAGLLVEFSVLESELNVIHVGLPVRISPVSMQERSYKGQITELNPFVNAQGLVLVRARLSQPDGRLFEGMNARVVVERQLASQLIIPKSAIVERSGRKVVFTIVNSLAKWNYVSVSHENESEATISEGLKPGDRVIISGNLNLGHNAPVQLEP